MNTKYLLQFSHSYVWNWYALIIFFLALSFVSSPCKTTVKWSRISTRVLRSKSPATVLLNIIWISLRWLNHKMKWNGKNGILMLNSLRDFLIWYVEAMKFFRMWLASKHYSLKLNKGAKYLKLFYLMSISYLQKWKELS